MSEIYVCDPRDSFMLMLKERIDCLEDTVKKLNDKVKVLETKNTHFECTKPMFSTNECVSAIQMWFWCDNENIDNAKAQMAYSVNSIVHKLGNDVFKSATAVITYEELMPYGYMPGTRLYMNFKNAVWIHEVSRLLHEIDFPAKTHINIDTRCICFFTHSNESNSMQVIEKGIAYSAYDLDGKKIDNPEWKEWEVGCEILKGPDAYISDDEWSDGQADFDVLVSN